MMAKSITRKAANSLMIGESILNLISLPLGLVSFGMSFALLTEVKEIPTEQVAEESAEAVEHFSGCLPHRQQLSWSAACCPYCLAIRQLQH